MYISELVKFLIWPIFILVSWFLIRAGLTYYERKFQANDQSIGSTGQKKEDIREESK